MNLALTTNDGEIVTVVEDIEDYDLSKQVAAVEVIEAIKTELARRRHG